MATGFCTRCGAVLRDGVCPRGHPQRASLRREARRRRRPEPRRRRRRGPVVFLILLLLLAIGAYAALGWYPSRAARDLMSGSSGEYVDASAAYHAALDALPDDANAEETVRSSDAVLARAEDARAAVTDAETRLEARDPLAVPVVSDRPPLDLALELREDMLAFYAGAAEAIGSLEDVASYLSEVSQALPQLDDLERALSEAHGEAAIRGAVENAGPIADQIVGDVEAVSPPDEMGRLHATLVALARRIRTDLEEAGRSTGPSDVIATTILADARAAIASFRESLAGTSDEARASGLGRRLADLRKLSDEIDRGLAKLRDQGVPGVSVPD